MHRTELEGHSPLCALCLTLATNHILPGQLRLRTPGLPLGSSFHVCSMSSRIAATNGRLLPRMLNPFQKYTNS